MRLVKVSMERKDHLVGINGCEHSWPCFGKPAIIFHDRGKIFTRRSCATSARGSVGDLDFTSSPVCAIRKRVDFILHSFRMMSVFLF